MRIIGKRIVIAALALAAVPATASAADYCVADATCVANGGTAEPTLEAALTAAQAAPGADRVLLGAGSFAAQTTNGFRVLSPVQIIGAGSGATTLTAPDNTQRVLYTDDPGSSVSDLAIQMPLGTDIYTKYGLSLAGGGSASRITVNGNPSSTSVSIGVRLYGATLSDSKVWMATTGTTTGAVSAQSDSTVTSTAVTGIRGIETFGPNIHLDRNQVTSSGTGVWVVNSATNIDLTNSVVNMLGNSTGVYAGTGNNTDAGLAVRNVTVVGDGTAGSIGIAAGSTTAHTADVSVDNSIIRGFAKPLQRSAPAGTANLSVSYSDYDPAGVYQLGPGTLTIGSGNINADPLFKGAFDLRVQPGSPVIDAGDPASFADALDFDGHPRVTDGDGNGSAVRDMGAFETADATPAPPAEPDPAPVPDPTPDPGSQPAGSGGAALPRLSGLVLTPARFRAARGTRISYRADTVGTTRFTVRRRAGGRYVTVGAFTHRELAGLNRLRFRGRLHGHLLKRGAYRLVAVPRDGSGRAGAAVLKAFRVL